MAAVAAAGVLTGGAFGACGDRGGPGYRGPDAVIRTIQTKLIAKGATSVTAAVQRHDPKAPSVKNIDDFAYVKDVVLLLAAKDLGILDKHEKDVLTEALNLRNRSGHPGKYRPGAKKVSAFLEDVTSIVFD